MSSCEPKSRTSQNCILDLVLGMPAIFMRCEAWLPHTDPIIRSRLVSVLSLRFCMISRSSVSWCGFACRDVVAAPRPSLSPSRCLPRSPCLPPSLSVPDSPLPPSLAPSPQFGGEWHYPHMARALLGFARQMFWKLKISFRKPDSLKKSVCGSLSHWGHCL